MKIPRFVRVPRLRGLQILVVDDMSVMQDIIVDILGLEGALTIRAKDGRQALDLLRDPDTSFIDAVIMDVNMPVMDGLETTSRIRSELGLHHLPIIACTSVPLPQIWAALLEAGFDDFQPKPIDPDDLIETLRRWTRPVA